ncbi:hypothetical protein DFJ58DRAFT_467307 [Suillus subalutaceus]|uniref:uncharacterized protein n=1 Tax=Suillus subalutaceus TaxID=48586 RepID=UPI001B87D1C2|nr:uncharacterized protein DFJ58DRAFT_467307 [Suillus subalutaceus]KAG1848544.1 hypothetical protein DFJ58DRAFT_467307 [Suillus subalutaceus]
MTLLLYTILACIAFVSASLPSLNGTSVRTLDASDCPSCNTRTLWDIIWSCGVTLFACTWTAVHTNVPGMDEKAFAITSRRLFTMVMALIAPELMVTWATRQFFSARAAAKDFNDEIGAQRAKTQGDHQVISEATVQSLGEIEKSSGSPSGPKPADFTVWTATNGFFAWMGGFMLYIDSKPHATLTPPELLHFVHEGYVDMPIITEADIEDRSKGDGLSKGIAILQLAWFVAQLVARYVQNLPVTLLEIDTLAITALTCIAYCLWWKKPKDVRRPYVVHWKATASPPSDLTYEKVESEDSGVCCLPYFFYLADPFVSLMGIDAYVSPRATRSHRIPSLGGYGDYHNMTTLFLGCFSGMVFGAMHCLCWNYSFQSHTEQWRAASLGTACVPVFLFINIGCSIWLVDMDSGHGLIMIIAATISSFIYIAARITLIILMMLSLRSLPPGVYDTVDWTRFVPHF